MTKTHKSKILASVHEAMQDAHNAGVIDKMTMREFDATCLTEVATDVEQAVRFPVRKSGLAGDLPDEWFEAVRTADVPTAETD